MALSDETVLYEAATAAGQPRFFDETVLCETALYEVATAAARGADVARPDIAGPDVA